MRHNTRVLLAASVLAGVFAGAASGRSAQTTQSTVPKKPPLVVESMAGRDLFEFYCSPCHGRSGKGDGPISKDLTPRPSDLTLVAAKKGGTFPRDEVRAIILGEGALVPAHLSDEMPVWGSIFRGLDPNEKRNQLRVANIVDYVASIQSKK